MTMKFASKLSIRADHVAEGISFRIHTDSLLPRVQGCDKIYRNGSFLRFLACVERVRWESGDTIGAGCSHAGRRKDRCGNADEVRVASYDGDTPQQRLNFFPLPQ
jgi:hypothetical protein